MQILCLRLPSDIMFMVLFFVAKRPQIVCDVHIGAACSYRIGTLRLRLAVDKTPLHTCVAVHALVCIITFL